MTRTVPPTGETPLEKDPRLVPLAGAFNVRHLGGYPTDRGLVTRSDAFFRGDSLHRLTPADAQTLRGRGIRTVIDLRGRRQRRALPDRLDGIEYRPLPLFEEWEELAVEEVGPVGLERFNELLLAQRQPALSRVFKLLAQPTAWPILVHCLAGKDRTGLIAGMVLALAGVAPATIAADYARSAANLGPIMDELRRVGAQAGYDPVAYEQVLRSPPGVMHHTLAHLDQRYGGVRAYMEHLGLTEAEVALLVQQLVPDP